MSEYEAKAALQAAFNQFQAKQIVRRGLIGDSNGTVAVSGRPGWAYIRYRENLNELSIVRYLLPDQLEDGTPVKVGRKYPDDPFEQVLGVDWDFYAYTPAVSEVGEHATPAIDLSDLSPGKVVPTVPASLSVDVRAFLYVDGAAVVEFGGGQLDLTGSVPGVAGHRLTLVYIDMDTDALAAEDGTIVAVATDATAPDVPEHGIPLAVVDLANGETDIDGDDISQYKALYLPVIGDYLVLVHDTNLNIQALTPTIDTLAYANDTPAFWVSDASYGMNLVPDLSLAVVHDGDVVTHDGEIVWAI